MIDFYDGNINSLLEWIKTDKYKTEHAPEPYWSWVYERLPVKSNISHGLGKMNEQSPYFGDWSIPYPHVHTRSMKWDPKVFTILTYLVAPEKGGEFALGGLSPNDPYQDITIKPGLTIGSYANIWHGVRPVLKGERIVLFTIGHP